MYKLKCCSKFKKCFKVLGNGNIKRRRVGGNHFLLKKTKRSKALLNKDVVISKSMFSTVKKRLFV